MTSYNFVVDDYANFANIFRSIGGSDFRYYAINKGFEHREQAERMVVKLKMIMDDINNKQSKWLPHEEYLFRVAESFRDYTKTTLENSLI